MKTNTIQFGITREDPKIELELIRRFNLNNVLMVASAGCTALHLLTYRPSLNLTLFDLNPSQIDLVKVKIQRLKQNDRNINYTGNFESLFNCWRSLVHEFILDHKAMTDLFQNPWTPERRQTEILNHPYWPVSFDLFFHETILKTMFGEAAIQHAPKGTYPRYFQKAFEKGLMDANYFKNPYLEHLFHGKFLTHEGYMESVPTNLDMSFILGSIQEIKDLKRFDLIQLSNIFDWTDIDGIKAIASSLCKEMKEGAFVLLRQINHDTNLAEFFPGFQFEEDLSNEMQNKDRSLFYSKTTIMRKV